MNSYYMIRRIRGPLMLLTFGFTAVLDQWNILNYGRSWPLYLIVLGVLGLAERAALAQAEPPASTSWQQPPATTPYSGGSNPGDGR